MIKLIAPFKLGPNAGPSIFGGVTQVGVSPEIAEEVRHNGGNVDPAMVFGASGEPKISASCLDVAGMLTLLSGGYLAIDSSNLGEYYLQAADEQGTRKTGSNHEKYVVTKGLAVLQTLSVEQGGDAVIDHQAYCVYDGTNEPIIRTAAVALPASTFPNLYTLGPVKFSGAYFEGIKGWSLDFGAEVRSHPYDGSVFPKLCYVHRFAPKIQVRGINTAALTSYGIRGQALNTTAVFYLRRWYPSGMVYADNEAQHASVTVYGRIAPGGPEGSDEAENSLTVSVVKSGANPLWAFASGVTIPAS